MKQLALSLPGYGSLNAPAKIPSGEGAPNNILAFSITLLFTAVMVAAVIFAIYGGILWITSQGDKQKLDKARRTIMFSIIGLVVAILSFAIIQSIGSLLGNDLLSNFGITQPPASN